MSSIKVPDTYDPSLPINSDPADGEAAVVLYNYIPSMVLSVIALISFAVTFFLHGWHAFRTRHRSFHVLLAVGSAIEVVGWASRAVSHEKLFAIDLYVVQYFTIVIAPVPISAALYLALTICTRLTDTTHLLPLGERWIVGIFVTQDVITIVVQALGSGLAGIAMSKNANGEDFFISADTSNNILLAGLVVQCAAFACFLVILLVVMKRVMTQSKYLSRSPHDKNSYEMVRGGVAADPYQASRPSSYGPLIRSLALLFLTSTLIWLRTLFRLAETAEGFWSEANSNETLFACLEYLPVILAVGAWACLPLRFVLNA